MVAAPRVAAREGTSPIAPVRVQTGPPQHAPCCRRVAELPHTRVHELVPWNWKADRHQTLAAQAGSHPTLRL